MEHLASHGYPVPAVYEASGPGMLLGRVPGPTLSQYLATRPWRINWAAHILRSLLDRLATVPPAPGLPHLFGAGDAILHLDLHPMNVLLGPSGPVVIDWPNAALGPSAADVAQSWLLVYTSQVPSPTAIRPVVRAGQRLLARRLLPRHDPARRLIPAVATHRITDINLTEIERRRVARLTGPAREP